MFARPFALLYGALSYLVFLFSFLYAIAFLGNFAVPKTIDVGQASGLTEAIVINLLLLGAFAVQHSVMARPAFKRWWTTIVPPHCERSTYVLLSSLLQLLLFWQWRPITAPIWQTHGVLATALTVIFALGWVIGLASTFSIDHFELFGLRQVAAVARRIATSAPVLRTPLLYRIVRHPLMFSFLLVFWATPEMSAGHLLFAVMSTLYILAALQLEERDLVALFGAEYEAYRKRVPMLLPRIPFLHRAQRAAGTLPNQLHETSNG
jgi:protein-S-isoprenylcysteine O-methyltransferase Ste14